MLGWKRFYCIAPYVHKHPHAHGISIPPTLWNFRKYSTWLGTLWKENLCQNVVALHILCEIYFSAIKMRKNLFIHVNTVSNNLKDVFSL